MHSKLYTLSDLASPLAPITSTAKVSILLPGQKPNSISMPTFLFYAFKAKRLAAAGISNENNISDEAYETFHIIMLIIIYIFSSRTTNVLIY